MRKWDTAPPIGGSVRFGREWDGHLLIERIWPGAQVEYIVAEALDVTSQVWTQRRHRLPAQRVAFASQVPQNLGSGVVRARWSAARESDV